MQTTFFSVHDKVAFVPAINMWAVKFDVGGKTYVQAYNTQEAALERWVELRTPETMEQITDRKFNITR